MEPCPPEPCLPHVIHPARHHTYHHIVLGRPKSRHHRSRTHVPGCPPPKACGAAKGPLPDLPAVPKPIAPQEAPRAFAPVPAIVAPPVLPIFGSWYFGGDSGGFYSGGVGGGGYCCSIGPTGPSHHGHGGGTTGGGSPGGGTTGSGGGSGGGGTTPIPEPTSLMILVAALTVMFLFRRLTPKEKDA